MQEVQTAILLFSRSLEAEFKAKSFGLTKDRFRHLYTALLKRTRKTLDHVDAPVFEFNSHIQVGNEFGDRLINAIRSVRGKGFSRIVVIGNDAPGLNPEILNAAIQRVKEGENVLGRDGRGGCYLMGFDTAKVKLDNFTQIEWHSQLVFDQVNDLLKADTSLPVLADLNGREDLKKALLFKTSPKWYILDLLLLVFNSSFKSIALTQQIRKITPAPTSYRGPPALALTPSY